jgi:polar amino acid transport system substrate-binding protein
VKGTPVRRHHSLFLFGLLVCFLASCHTPTPTGSGPGRLEGILESRELRVGLTGDQPPLNMRNKAGEIIGLEVDLVNMLAESMGLETRLVTMKFAELIPALERGEVDLVISGMTITPERNARVAFVGPYFVSGKSVLTRSGTMTNASSPEELDGPERSYASLAGSTSEQFVKKLLPNARLTATPDYETAIGMVLDGSVDAMIADYPICALAVLRNPEADLLALMTPFTIEPLGIALPAGDPLLVNLVENYLNSLDETGLLTRFKAKWLTDGSWISELP